MKNLVFLLLSTLFFIGCSSSDDGVEDSSTVITVSNFTVSLNENPSAGAIIGTVQANSSSGNIQLSITNQSPSGAVAVNNQGVLTVANAALFNFELNPSISGTLRASSNNVSENFNFLINLNDINETIVCQGPIRLSTQEEVNAFGAQNCTIVEGSLVIGPGNNQPNDSIIDLSPLEGLTTVTGWFGIEGNLTLESIAPLHTLIEIEGGGPQIMGNPSLQNLNGLEGLTETNGPVTFSILDNDALTNLQGLNNIVSINATFSVGGNESITSLDGLDSLENLGQISIGNNAQLRNIEALKNVTEIFRSSISINFCPMLESIKGLRNVRSIQDNLELSYLEKLESLEGLESLTHVGSRIYLFGNENLENLDGLLNVAVDPLFDGLYVQSNTVLDDFCGVSSIVKNISSNDFIVNGNAYNPTKQDIIDGNCSL